MRYLWIEDFDGGKSGRTEIKRELERYFQLKENINLDTLEKALEFLDVPFNWNLFDAVLIDIRFKVCEKEQDESTIYEKYFSSFLTKEKYDYYTYKIEGDANTASSGVLLYLALIHKYNYNQNRIAFISANVDDVSDRLFDINNMREYILKAKYGQLEELDKEEFSILNQNIFELYMKEMNLEEEEANRCFSIPEENDIDWKNLDKLESQVDDVENQLRAVLKKNYKGENNDLKYNSVKREFENVGLKVPIAFEKPSGYYNKSDISWRFKNWVEQRLSVDYYRLRESILPICINIKKLLEEDFESKAKMPYNNLIERDRAGDVKDRTMDVKDMLSKIVELFPGNVWIENKNSFYSRIIRECVSLCDGIPKEMVRGVEASAEAAVLKIVRNWMSHQGIKNIEAYDVAFIFYVLVVAFFQYDDKYEGDNYVDKAKKLVLKLDSRKQIKPYNITEQIEKMVNIVKVRHKEAYERFQEKGGQAKDYRYSENASIYDAISAIGHQNSDLRETVSIEYIDLLYLGMLNLDIYEKDVLVKSLADRLICSKVFEK